MSTYNMKPLLEMSMEQLRAELHFSRCMIAMQERTIKRLEDELYRNVASAGPNSSEQLRLADCDGREHVKQTTGLTQQTPL